MTMFSICIPAHNAAVSYTHLDVYKRQVLFGAGRAEEGGPAPARIPQAASHGLGPASRLGAGLAAQGVEPGTDRGTVEGPVRRRPVDADQPRVPLPVDLRQAAAGDVYKRQDVCHSYAGEAWYYRSVAGVWQIQLE